MGQISVKTYAANGSLLNDNQQEGVTKAVLTAIYNAEHKEWSKQKDEDQPASEADELDALINAAVNDTEFAQAA